MIEPISKNTVCQSMCEFEIIDLSGAIGSMVYFLISEKRRIIYIGQTRNLKSRMQGHKDKEFHYLAYFKCDPSNIDEFEASNIIAHAPELNKSIPMCSELSTTNKLSADIERVIFNHPLMENYPKINLNSDAGNKRPSTVIPIDLHEDISNAVSEVLECYSNKPSAFIKWGE